MKRKLAIFLISTFALFGLAGQALALGFGAYVEGATGTGEFEYVDRDDNFDVDASATGYGLVFDTDLRGERRFNLRFSLGYEQLDLEDDAGVTLNLEGVTMSGTFGFPLNRDTNYHWWAGPQVRLGFYSGDAEGIPDIDYEFVALGLGGAVGFNYTTRSGICISTSAGLLLTGYGGEMDDAGYHEDVEGSTTTAFANFAMLFGD